MSSRKINFNPYQFDEQYTETEHSKNTGLLIKSKRKQKHLTQRDLVEKCSQSGSLNVKKISKIENGEIPISVYDYNQICKVLDINYTINIPDKIKNPELNDSIVELVDFLISEEYSANFIKLLIQMLKEGKIRK